MNDYVKILRMYDRLDRIFAHIDKLALSLKRVIFYLAFRLYL